MRASRTWLGGLVVSGVLAFACSVGAPAAQATSPGKVFFGVAPQTNLSSADFAQMQGTVGTVRLPFNWHELEPRPGGYELGAIDEEVRTAAANRIVVLPVVYGTPAWLSPDPARPPLASARARGAWMAFLR